MAAKVSIVTMKSMIDESQLLVLVPRLASTLSRIYL